MHREDRSICDCREIGLFFQKSFVADRKNYIKAYINVKRKLNVYRRL